MCKNEYRIVLNPLLVESTHGVLNSPSIGGSRRRPRIPLDTDDIAWRHGRR